MTCPPHILTFKNNPARQDVAARRALRRATRCHRAGVERRNGGVPARKARRACCEAALLRPPPLPVLGGQSARGAAARRDGGVTRRCERATARTPPPHATLEWSVQCRSTVRLLRCFDVPEWMNERLAILLSPGAHHIGLFSLTLSETLITLLVTLGRRAISSRGWAWDDDCCIVRSDWKHLLLRGTRCVSQPPEAWFTKCSTVESHS